MHTYDALHSEKGHFIRGGVRGIRPPAMGDILTMGAGLHHI